jgi:hypothetical protein
MRWCFWGWFGRFARKWGMGNKSFTFGESGRGEEFTAETRRLRRGRGELGGKTRGLR